MSLSDQLKQNKANSVKRIPAEIRSIMMQASQALAATDIGSLAPKVGDEFPDFNLVNHLEQSRSLSHYLSDGPAVITFYRGGWCPYCNLELRAYQQDIELFKEMGASIVAISPQLPDSSLSTQEKNDLAFDVLSDIGLEYSRQLDLVFSLDEKLKPIYKDFGIDLSAYNGDSTFALPIPATFLVDTKGKVASAHIDIDYTQRQEPSELLALVKTLSWQT